MLSEEKISLAEEYFERAFQSQLDGEIDEAIDDYKKSIKFYATAKAHTFLGHAYSLKGEYESAISECKKAITLNPEYGDSYYDIGIYLLNLGSPNRAISWFEKAACANDYEPKHFPFYNLGKIYEKKYEWLKAIEYYNKALILNQDYEPAQNAVIKMATLLN